MIKAKSKPPMPQLVPIGEAVGMADRGLHRDVRQVLADMATISEGPAGHIGRGRGGESDQVGPGGPPPSERLLAVWTQRFANCRDDEARLRVTLRAAQAALSRRRRRQPAVISQDEWESENRIIEWYEGQPAAEVAAIESETGTLCSEAYIRRLRLRNGCDPELGRPRPPRERWAAIARSHRAAGRSLRWIARDMGVALATVQRLLEEQNGHGKAA